MDTYDLFIYQGPKIQSEWLNFVSYLDKKLEKVLKNSVKNTLVDLSKHIKGDSKSDIVPIFKVYTIIDPNDIGWNVIHDPSHKELKVGIERFIGEINGAFYPNT